MYIKRKLFALVLCALLLAASLGVGSGPIDAALHNLATAEGGCGGG